MTTNEKRQSNLEKNRLAAQRSRQKKRERLLQLEAQVNYLLKDNEKLTHTNMLLKEEILELKAKWMQECREKSQRFH